MTDERFSRTEMLLGEAAMKRLKAAHVAVFGVGGVGGYVVEALARSGIGSLTLVDHDTVSLSNLNRQIIATEETLGRKKVLAAAARVRSINPDCRVTVRDEFFLPENADSFDFSAFDYVVDAVDTVSAKLAIVMAARAAGVPVISSMGAGNKLDPTLFRVSDISKTSVCPLAKVMRRLCREHGIDRLKVVWSPEEPRKPLGDTPADAAPGKRQTPGSVAFVPAAAGLILAGEVVRDLTEKC